MGRVYKKNRRKTRRRKRNKKMKGGKRNKTSRKKKGGNSYLDIGELNWYWEKLQENEPIPISPKWVSAIKADMTGTAPAPTGRQFDGTTKRQEEHAQDGMQATEDYDNAKYKYETDDSEDNKAAFETAGEKLIELINTVK